jgi:DNA-binding transcriptional ArsR family regulator
MAFDDELKALADPTRQEILTLLVQGEQRAGDIAAAFAGMSRPAVSQHLRVLRESGLVRQRREGTARYYSIDVARVHSLWRFLEHFWDLQGDGGKSLEQVVPEAAG